MNQKVPGSTLKFLNIALIPILMDAGTACSELCSRESSTGDAIVNQKVVLILIIIIAVMGAIAMYVAKDDPAANGPAALFPRHQYC